MILQQVPRAVGGAVVEDHVSAHDKIVMTEEVRQEAHFVPADRVQVDLHTARRESELACPLDDLPDSTG
jgi:hypothetical protein